LVSATTTMAVVRPMPGTLVRWASLRASSGSASSSAARS
jgi:hypothetical protein